MPRIALLGVLAAAIFASPADAIPLKEDDFAGPHD
jgi:hypothetical protein